MSPRRRKRLDPAVFQLPAARIKAGEFSDRYAALAPAVLRQAKKNPRVLLQVTAKQDGCLSGIDESIAILKHGVERGAVRPEALQPRVVNLAPNLLTHYFLTRGHAAPQQVIDEILDQVVMPLITADR